MQQNDDVVKQVSESQRNTACVTFFDNIWSKNSQIVSISDVLDFERYTTDFNISRKDYGLMTKKKKSELKNTTKCFIGGECEDGSRKAINRSFLTFDIDKATSNFVSEVQKYMQFDCLVYSTASHTAEKPRYRVLVPLLYSISADVFSAFSKLAAKSLLPFADIDSRSHAPSQVMFLPVRFLDLDDEDIVDENTIGDGFFFQCFKKDIWLDPTSILGLIAKKKMYYREEKKSTCTRYEEAFTQKYDVVKALSEFLSEVYLPTSTPDRYKYLDSSSTPGAVVYDDGNYLFSFHASDPANNRLMNSFHLVRLHRYGHLDAGGFENKSVKNLPSYKAMCDFVENDLKLELPEEEECYIETNSVSRPPEIRFDKLYTYVDKKTGMQKPDFVMSNFRIFLDGLGIKIRYNLMIKNIEIQIPGVNVELGYEYCVNMLRSKLRDYRFSRIRECFDESVHIVAFENVYHPVREYFDCISEQESVDFDYLEFQKLVDSLVVSEKNYSEELKVSMIRKWLLYCVESILEPDTVRMPCMLILAYEQDDDICRKWFKRLIPDANWMYICHHLDSKRYRFSTSTSQILRYWISMISGSLGSLASRLRASDGFLRKQSDYYSDQGKKIIRQTNFCGVSDNFNCLPDNDSFYRLIPCSDIQFNGKLNVSRLWDEVISMYHTGFRSRLSDREKKQLESYNSNFVSFDDVNSPLYAAFKWQTKERYWMTLEDVYNIVRNNQKLSLAAIQRFLRYRKIVTKAESDVLYYAMPKSCDIYFSSANYKRVDASPGKVGKVIDLTDRS